jgi:PhnB protein
MLNAYLSFNGTCAEAFRFYERSLGGKIEMLMTHGESPMRDQFPADWHDRVMHVRLTVGHDTLMGGDAPPDRYEAPHGFCLSVSAKTRDEAERLFGELSANGKVTMPFEKTFWSTGFGMAIDRFGIPWMVNTEEAPAAAG